LHIHGTFVLLHGFVKKSEQTPISELEKAKDYMMDYLKRRE
jgi:phage-related protein